MRQDQQRLHELCYAALAKNGLDTDEQYTTRLKKELKELDAQGEWEYFLKLHDQFKLENLIFPQNEHNNLIDFLLGLTESVDISKPSAFVQGESPDIDIDYLKTARDYIKREWAPKQFGQEKICEIGTYGTSGIKSSIKHMARLHSLSKDEIEAITTKMKDKFTDDEGNTQELDWEGALKIYPEFAAYCEKNPEVAKAAYLLLDRNNTAGVHAGGLVISNIDIDGFVPLEVRMVNKDNPNGIICAAWTEGLNRQDLGPVGLIKFDLLVINNLLQIAVCAKLIKERYPEIAEKGLWALPGGDDWSDLSYLNDVKALEMANKADLKCIFQFDSEGIRKLVKRGGVTMFDDLAAYSAIYRPGPLNCLRHDTKVSIKGGEKAISNLCPEKDEVKYIDGSGKVNCTNNFILTKTGNKKLLKITTKNGNVIYVSRDHKILTENNYKKSEDVKIGDKIAIVK